MSLAVLGRVAQNDREWWRTQPAEADEEFVAEGQRSDPRRLGSRGGRTRIDELERVAGFEARLNLLRIDGVDPPVEANDQSTRRTHDVERQLLDAQGLHHVHDQGRRGMANDDVSWPGRTHLETRLALDVHVDAKTAEGRRLLEGRCGALTEAKSRSMRRSQGLAGAECERAAGGERFDLR